MKYGKHIYKSLKPLANLGKNKMKRLLYIFACVAFVPLGAMAEGLMVKNVWARPTFGEIKTSAVYLDIINETNEDDRLVSVHTPVAGMVEIHETTVDAHGIMRMSEMEDVKIQKNTQATLKPEGMHIMLMNVKNL